MAIGSLTKKLLSVLCLIGAVTWSSCRSEDDDPDVTANEELYINEISAAGDDWIELYNNTAASKNLGGYKIYDDPASKYVLPPGTSIAANGYLIIFCNDANTGLNTNFKLTSAGETVWLENASGDIIDKVTFPALDNDQSYARFPDGNATFAISGNPTEGSTNGGSSAPSILSVSRNPKVPTKEQAVNILATLASTTGVSTVKLYHRFEGGSFTAIDMSANGNGYSAAIPATNATGLVEYYVEAKSASGETTRHPATATDKLHDYLINEDPLPQLVINEFMALNVACCADNSSGLPEYDDWIEIYNAGSVAVNIADFYLSDDVTSPFNSRIPATNAAATTIQPGGYLVIWADGQEEQGELHVDFSLLQTGEAVGLYYKDGRPIDEVEFGTQTADKSIGRSPNGTGSFQVLSSPTHGAAN